MIPNAERMYENLNGREVGECLKQMLEKLSIAVSNSPTLQQHLAWPKVKLTVEATIEGEAMTPLKLSLSEGPAFAPDQFREIFGLGIPLVVNTPGGKKVAYKRTKTKDETKDEIDA